MHLAQDKEDITKDKVKGGIGGILLPNTYDTEYAMSRYSNMLSSTNQTMMTKAADECSHNKVSLKEAAKDY